MNDASNPVLPTTGPEAEVTAREKTVTRSCSICNREIGTRTPAQLYAERNLTGQELLALVVESTREHIHRALHGSPLQPNQLEIIFEQELDASMSYDDDEGTP